jgi:hypothetical protein
LIVKRFMKPVLRALALRSLLASQAIGSDSDLRRKTRIAASPISKMSE